MKAREIREQLRNVVDPRLLTCLEAICEELQLQKHTQVELAKMMNQLADNLNLTHRLLGSSIEHIERMKGINKNINEIRETHINRPQHLEDKKS